MKTLASVLIILVSVVWCNQHAEAMFGWGPADIVLDFGVDLEPGDQQVLVEQEDVGHPFHVDVMWRLQPQDCLIQAMKAVNGDGTSKWHTLADDQLFHGNPAHAIARDIETLAVVTQEGKPCRINQKLDEFVVVSEIKETKESEKPRPASAPLGATVMIFRATTFFTPNVVTIHAGERVVWIYADGAKEPHTTTNGSCRGTDCSGGGKNFDSGKTLYKAGHRFEHVFKHSGTFPYHCNLHNASMVGTVVVKPNKTK